MSIGPIETNVAKFVSRSGKFIINIGEINVTNPPETIDIGVTPKDIDKIIGKEFYASFLLGGIGDTNYSNYYSVSPFTYEFGEDNGTAFYDLKITIAEYEFHLITSDENSSIWAISV